jgi:hypothetical protein
MGGWGEQDATQLAAAGRQTAPAGAASAPGQAWGRPRVHPPAGGGSSSSSSSSVSAARFRASCGCAASMPATVTLTITQPPRPCATPPPPPRPSCPHQVCVQGIPWAYTNKELGELLAECGEVERADVMLSPDGRSKVRARVRRARARGWCSGCCAPVLLRLGECQRHTKMHTQTASRPARVGC